MEHFPTWVHFSAFQEVTQRTPNKIAYLKSTQHSLKIRSIEQLL